MSLKRKRIGFKIHLIIEETCLLYKHKTKKIKKLKFVFVSNLFKILYNKVKILKH